MILYKVPFYFTNISVLAAHVLKIMCFSFNTKSINKVTTHLYTYSNWMNKESYFQRFLFSSKICGELKSVQDFNKKEMKSNADLLCQTKLLGQFHRVLCQASVYTFTDKMTQIWVISQWISLMYKYKSIQLLSRLFMSMI